MSAQRFGWLMLPLLLPPNSIAGIADSGKLTFPLDCR
jgi:hypothetical protein